MEAAAAYYEVTGKDRLLHVMERMAETYRGNVLEQKKVKNRAFRDIRKSSWDFCVSMK